MMYKSTIEDRSFRWAYLKQIRKDRARRMFNEGVEIFILPKEINPCSYHNLTHRIKSTYNIDFDELIKFERKDKFNNKNGELRFYFLDMNNPRQLPESIFA